MWAYQTRPFQLPAVALPVIVLDGKFAEKYFAIALGHFDLDGIYLFLDAISGDIPVLEKEIYYFGFHSIAELIDFGWAVPDHNLRYLRGHLSFIQ